MSLFDSASICITPNGVKEGKLYSIKPSDGSGDLSVTRATTATRVNSAGLVELVPVNLLTYSEQFNDSSWVKSASTITANATTAPNGTLTADKLVDESVLSQHRVDQTPTTAIGTYTFSVYLKKAEIDTNWLRIGSLGATFNLTSGTIISTGAGVTASIESFPNGWYRCSITRTTTGTNEICRINLKDGSYLGTGTDGLFIWGAQLVEGSSAKDYYPTTTRLNIPRLDYTNGSCPSILVEPQRTNLCLYSEQFDNAGWAKDNTSVTANTTISPSGISNADKVLEDTTNSIHRIREAGRLSSGTQTASCYFKAAERSFVFMGITDLTTGEAAATFNLSNGTGVNSSSGSWTNTSFTIDSVGNGWYRCTVTGTQVLGIGSRLDIYISNGSTISYAGTTGYGLFMWGAQIEVGAYATSLIPTQASTVTRNQDVISKTGISSLIGQTEGTILLDYIPKSNYPLAEQNLLTLYNSSNADNNNIQIFIANSGNIAVYILSSGTLQSNLNTGVSSLTSHKIAISYANNDVAVYIDGVQVGTDTSITVPTLNSIILNNYAYGNYMSASAFKNVTLWKTRLTNEQLAQLTTI